MSSGCLSAEPVLVWTMDTGLRRYDGYYDPVCRFPMALYRVLLWGYMRFSYS